MRIFVSHRVDDESEHATANEEPATTAVPSPKPAGGKDFGALLSAAAHHHIVPQKKSIREWTLVVEGGLLIKQLDHDSVKEVDRRWAAGLAILGGTDDKEQGEAPMKREQWSGGGPEQESDRAFRPLIFTHLFDKLEVEMKSMKESATEGAAATSEGETTAKVKTFTWERAKSNIPDSHAFYIKYEEEGLVPIVDPNDKEQSGTPKAEYNSDYVLATVKLYRRQGDAGNYVPSNQLCEVFFPSFIGKKPVMTSQSKKRKASDLSSDSQSDPPKDVIVPNTLTLDEALSAIFFYIRTRNLQDATDLSAINNDATLTELFGCNRMMLSDVKRILLEKGLLVKVEYGTHPIIFNYRMTMDGAEPLAELMPNEEEKQVAPASPPQANEANTTRTRSSNDPDGSRVKEKEEGSAEMQKATQPAHQTMLSCDVDIEIPNLFHPRTRDILRRINDREFEYSSCRNKAKNVLVAAKIDERTAKLAVEDAITGKGYAPHFKQVWAALAKSSHEGGEAQRAALIELRTTSLMEKLEEKTAIARGYWDVVEACRGLTDNVNTQEEANA
jgi:chromatin remodeling complex protein RSC6